MIKPRSKYSGADQMLLGLVYFIIFVRKKKSIQYIFLIPLLTKQRPIMEKKRTQDAGSKYSVPQ